MIKNIEIIFEDRDILVCRKPAGIATQTKRLGQQDMESLLKNYRAKKGETPYIGIVHRLDQPVEGVMVFTKNQKAAAHLSKQVQDRVIGKYYYALVEHFPDIEDGVLEDYLVTDKKKNVTTVIDYGVWKDSLENLPKEAKYAKLECKYVKHHNTDQVCKVLVDIKLHTGRQHQIRVQMASAGTPLIGDSKYGDGKEGEQLALCSYKLEFEHPTKKYNQLGTCLGSFSRNI